MQWLKSRGKRGHLHIADDQVPNRTRCGRMLGQPELGAGLDEAKSTGCEWSPRCRAHLKSLGKNRFCHLCSG